MLTRALPILVGLTLMIYALIDCLQTDRAEIRGPRKSLWAVLIALLPFAGPIAWLIARGGHPTREQPRPSARPVAPDDNLEFLEQIRELDSEHENMLSQWEDDLRRREEEMRKRRDADDD